MYAAYYLTLGALAIVTWLGGWRAFGLRAFRHAPSAAIVVAIVVGLAAPVLLKRTERKEIPRSGPDARFVLFAVLVALAAGILFRARGFYLGDGWQSLALFSGPWPFVKQDALATGLLLRAVAPAFHADERALRAYEVVSLAAGVLFLVACGTLGSPLAATVRDRQRLLLFLAAGGWSLLFFGYVENYPLFAAATAAYALAGARAARDGQGLWEAAVMALAAVSLHTAGLLLLPSLIVLLLARTAVGRAAVRAPAAVQVGVVLAGGAGVVLAARRLLADLSRDLLFVPLSGSPFVADGYTMFSTKHVLDVANLAVLLLPGAAPLAVVVARVPLREVTKDGAVRFTLFLAVTLSFAVFVLDPKLGMARDWDFFAFTGIPWALLAFLLLTAKANPRIADGRRALELATVLGFLALFGRAATNASEARAYAVFRDDLLPDPARGRPARMLAVNHWRRLGREDLAEAEAVQWDRDYPERVFVREAIEARSRGDVEEAIRLNRQAIARAPNYSDPWNNLGSIDLALGHVMQGLSELETAHALSPDEPSIWMNLGLARYAVGDVAGATRWYLRAWERAPDGALVNKALARLAQRRGDDAGYERYLGHAAAAPEAPGALLVEWADRLTAKGRTAEALAAYRDALARGVTDSTRAVILAAHPALVESSSVP